MTAPWSSWAGSRRNSIVSYGPASPVSYRIPTVRRPIGTRSEYAARRIDIGHGQLRTALHLLAAPSVLARHRACNPDQHVRLTSDPDVLTAR